MKKIVILISGEPGTGKTYLTNLILNKLKDITKVSPDEIKECFWDKHGFQNKEEKVEITERAWNYYFKKMNLYMKEGLNLISDYPFSEKHYRFFHKLEIRYKNTYLFLTLMLVSEEKNYMNAT